MNKGLLFSIIGCGRVGTALAVNLSNSGHRPSGFFSRTRESAAGAAGAAGCSSCVRESSWEAAAEAEVVFITTPDHAISSVCRKIADNRGFRKGACVLHCSGALSSGILSSAADCGAYAGSMHPLQSFASDTGGNPFKGIKAAVEGDGPAAECARRIASDLGAHPFSIRTEGKTLYHAAAVAASNYLVTLMRLSFKLLSASGVPESEAYDVLKPLISGTLGNIEKVGIPEALTGPIARGDVETVEDHLSAIRELSSEAADMYCRLGLATIDTALEKGSLSGEAAERLISVLKG